MKPEVEIALNKVISPIVVALLFTLLFAWTVTISVWHFFMCWNYEATYSPRERLWTCHTCGKNWRGELL